MDDDNEILLLLWEELTSMKDPEPQVIAEAQAIAAFVLHKQSETRM
jgi:hypothetical protein